MNPMEINNVGQPLRGPDGLPMGGVKIEWTLSTIEGLPVDAIDTVTGERFLPVPISAVTSAVNVAGGLQIGEFRLLAIWPTSRADRNVFYRCVMKGVPGGRTIIAPVAEADTPLKWSDFLSWAQPAAGTGVTSDDGSTIQGG